MGKKIDLIGQRFGRLIVLKYLEHNKDRRKVWLCKCDCGNITKGTTSNMICGKKRSCGCLRKEAQRQNGRKTGRKNGGKNKKDLKGFVFGRLIILEETGKIRNTNIEWLCICRCGKKVKVVSAKLLSGRTRSCGCLKINALKMLHKNNRIYPKDAYKLSSNKRGAFYLSNTYIKRLIIQQNNVEYSEISVDLVKQKRSQIKIYREIKKARRLINGLN